MLKIRTWVMTGVVVALLVACGGNDPDVPGSGQPSGAPTTKGTFTAVVSFGDSLSDVGTYAPATSLTANGLPPYAGGRFTTNYVTLAGTVVGTVWVENLAQTLGLVVTPAKVGFGAVSQDCPAAAVPALANTCTAYGEGGARVTDPNGIGHGSGFLTVPVVTQVANHLARFTRFSGSDLILVWAGHNDALTQFTTFTTTAAQIQADATAGRITADQANLALFAAQTAAQAAMKQAAQDLAGYVKNQILANGGQYVAVIAAVDFGGTPLVNGLLASPTTAGVAPVLIGLARTFNLWLRDGLTGLPVQLIDPNLALQGIAANPASYGLTNITTPACDATTINAIWTAAAGGSSLFCSAAPGAPYNTLAPLASTTTWLFADSIHPTTGGHAIVSTYVAQQLKAFGWIN
jgi:phospholipase/lecithinase/hemolysin